MQVNEDEMSMMAPDPLALAATAMARGVKTLVVTLGARGAVYFVAPEFDRLSDLGRDRGVRPIGGAVRTALVPAPSASVKPEGDPTGCGDVFGGTYFSRLLAGDSFSDALHCALRAATRNLAHRGASGLASYLRGELIVP
jgi:sugar/nucleoside kinase (ribokinase family)